MSEAIRFVGHLQQDAYVLVDVSFRGENVGSLHLNLGQWDQLRDDVRGIDRPGWVSCIANGGYPFDAPSGRPEKLTPCAEASRKISSQSPGIGGR